MHATAQLNRAKEAIQERTEDCSICKKTGCLTDDGWYTESSLDRDEDGYYMAGHGEYLGDSVETPSGWVCSKRCRSQEMYQRANRYEREALRKVHDACRVIAEYGKDALRTVEVGMEEGPSCDFVQGAIDFLDALDDDGDDMPAWCNRETCEASLEQAIRDARRRIGYLCEDIGSDTTNEITFNVQSPFFMGRRARQAASAALIAETLKAAEDTNA